MGAISVALPAALIGVWGALYLADCFRAILNADVPVEYTLQTEGGPVVIRAEAWTLNVAGNRLVATGITATGPSAERLASVSRVEVREALPLPWKTRASGIRVWVEGLAADIERDAKGEFPLAKFIPVQDPTAEPTAVTVELKGTRLRFKDRYGGKPWNRTLVSARTVVQSFGEQFAAKSEVSVIGEGKATLTARSLKGDRYQVRGNLAGMRLGEMLSHLQQTPDSKQLGALADVRVAQLDAVGPFRLVFGGKSDARFELTTESSLGKVAFEGKPLADSARARGLITMTGFVGDVRAAYGGSSANWSGSVSWADAIVWGGNVEARAESPQSLPALARNLLPSDVGFRGATFEGWISGEDVEFEAEGNLAAQSFTYQAERFNGLDAQASVRTDQVALRNVTGDWNGMAATGDLSLAPETGVLVAAATSRSVNLATLARRYGWEGISGRGDVTALVTGTTEKPRLAAIASGDAIVQTSGRKLDFGSFGLVASLESGKLHVRRFDSDGPAGIMTGSGQINLANHRLSGTFLGSGIPLRLIERDLSGTAAAVGTLAGTVEDPKVEGRFEAYDARYRDYAISLALSDFTLDRRRAVATELLAIRGATRLDGSLAYNFKDGKLNGNGAATGIQLADLLGEAFAGSVNAPRLFIQGTLNEPIIEADLDANSIVAGGIGIDAAKALLELEDGVVTASAISLESGESKVVGQGTYNIEKRTATYNLEGTGLALADLIAEENPAVQLLGAADLKVEGLYSEAGGFDFAGDATFARVKVNGTDVGGGAWTFAWKGDKLNAAGSLGNIDRFLEAPRISFDRAANRVEADLIGHSLAANDLYAIMRRYLPFAKVSEQAGEQGHPLEQLRADLDFDATVTGSLLDPNIAVRLLTASDIQFQGLEGGKLEAVANRLDRVWTIDKLLWTGGPGIAEAKGVIQEDGDIQAEGDLNNIDPAWFATLEPRLARLKGKGDIGFKVTGPTRDPRIAMSLGYREGEGDSKDRRQIDLLADIASGQATFDGSYYFEGFTGPVTAKLPFEYPFRIPNDQPIEALATLPPRALNELKDLLPWLDIERSQGEVSGSLSVTGTLDDLKLGGDLKASGSRLAAAGVGASLAKFTLDGLFAGGALRFSGSAEGDRGGSIQMQDVEFKFGNLSDVFSETVERLLQKPISGKIAIRDLAVAQGTANTAAYNGSLSGDIDISGPVQSPLLSGTMRSKGSTFTVGELPQGEAGGAPFVDPRFAIRLNIDDPLNLKAGTGTFMLTGGGDLTGRLSMPEATMDLEVDKGALRLPNARIFIEPGGKIQVRYRSTPYGPTAANAYVNLIGRTQITAPGFGDSFELYSITLDIQGDILADGGLAISAYSDPPLLSSERILTLLGQGELIAGRPGENRSVRVDQQIQAALSIALPYVIGGFTERLSAGLGLDYLGIEYGSSSLITVTAAKSLGRDFMLSVRRQVSTPLPGQKAKLDVRLSYRLPVRNRFLSRLSFSVGFDQDRPWKLAIEYGIRF